VWQIRHRRSAAPAEALTPHGQTEAREIGEAFAGVLDDLRRACCSVEVTRFLHEHTEVAEATALAFQSAYQQTADAIEAEYGCGPLPLAHMEAIDRNMSAYINDPGLWAETTIKRLTSNDSRPTQGKGTLIIGHDPGMSYLLTTLLHRDASKVGRDRDVPGLARAELLCMRSNGRRWRPMWALTPSADDDIAKITEKIKSKMDTAKVFGGFVTAVLTFVVSQYATTTTKATYWAAVRGLSDCSSYSDTALPHDSLLLRPSAYASKILGDTTWRQGESPLKGHATPSQLGRLGAIPEHAAHLETTVRPCHICRGDWHRRLRPGPN
jgi:phosphohistidine phosphatase SixA